MFVSAGQFYYFAECLFIGALSGLISEILLISVPLSSKFAAVGKITDFLRFVVAGAAVALFPVSRRQIVYAARRNRRKRARIRNSA